MRIHAKSAQCKEKCKKSFIHYLLIAMIEEIDGFEFGFQAHFLLGRDVLEGCAIGTQVETDELHDALAAHDVTTEMADDVDDILSVVLQLAGFLQVTSLPGFDDAYEATAVVVRSAADAALCAAHSEAREDGLVLTVEHIELSVLVATAAVVLIEALEGVFDAGEIGDAAVDSLQEVVHREECTVEGGMW